MWTVLAAAAVPVAPGSWPRLSNAAARHTQITSARPIKSTYIRHAIDAGVGDTNTISAHRAADDQAGGGPTACQSIPCHARDQPEQAGHAEQTPHTFLTWRKVEKHYTVRAGQVYLRKASPQCTNSPSVPSLRLARKLRSAPC
jgi:hypothetical protein